MKERLFDVIKWWLILIMAGIVFLAVYPKYYFTGPKGHALYRCNKISGKVERWDRSTSIWITQGRHGGIFGGVFSEIGGNGKGLVKWQRAEE
jgi:hypothetical protein